jgi:hypothetical protein
MPPFCFVAPKCVQPPNDYGSIRMALVYFVRTPPKTTRRLASSEYIVAHNDKPLKTIKKSFAARLRARKQSKRPSGLFMSENSVVI